MAKKRAVKRSAPEFYDIHISVLGFREEGQWVAIALEIDLRGYGKTFKKALAELEELMEMQISFARFKNDPDLIFHPAEPAFWGLFAQVSQDRLRALSNAIDDTESEYQVGGLALPHAHEIANFSKDFALDRA
ncbi:MAG: hypothetical protein A2W28_12065 [Gammaproteobacteria bacterium RBG_16_51_14]|nr:MAG: hypothetical protein A2W28_12065 [Gammaproteobacteria bacterium RBG_16_51_14]